jgi:hypothetical protein
MCLSYCCNARKALFTNTVSTTCLCTYVCCNHPAPRAEGSSRERLEDIANNKYTAKRRLQELETHARSQLVENRATLAAQVQHVSEREDIYIDGGIDSEYVSEMHCARCSTGYQTVATI